MDGENLGMKLLNTLGLEVERAEELMDKVLDLAVKHETTDFFIKELPEILKMAETPEEALFLGFFGAIVSNDMAVFMNPFGTLAGATHTMKVLAERKAEKTAKN